MGPRGYVSQHVRTLNAELPAGATCRPKGWGDSAYQDLLCVTYSPCEVLNISISLHHLGREFDAKPTRC